MIRSAISTAIHKSCYAANDPGSASFSPLQLFANGEAGAWYDPSDLTTMFQDYAGTAAAVDSPVKLLLDKRLGDPLDNLSAEKEIADKWESDEWNSVSGWTFNGSNATASATTVAVQSAAPHFQPTAGKWYRVTITVDSISGDAIRFRLGNTLNASAISSSGTSTWYIRAANTNSIQLVPNAGTGLNAVISDYSIKEIPGNHAYQDTDSKRPMLRQSGGLYYLETDGVDDFFVLPNAIVDVSEPQAMSCGFALDDAGSNPYVLGTNALDEGFELLFSVSTRKPRMYIVPSSGIVVSGTSADAVTIGEAHVYTQTYNGAGTGVIYQDQVQIVTDSQSVSTIDTPTTSYNLFSGQGGFSARCVAGKCYGFVIVSKTLTAAEKSSLESYVAGKSGVSL